MTFEGTFIPTVALGDAMRGVAFLKRRNQINPAPFTILNSIHVCEVRPKGVSGSIFNEPIWQIATVSNDTEDLDLDRRTVVFVVVVVLFIANIIHPRL
jgi:hypothetical protein